MRYDAVDRNFYDAININSPQLPLGFWRFSRQLVFVQKYGFSESRKLAYLFENEELGFWKAPETTGHYFQYPRRGV